MSRAVTRRREGPVDLIEVAGDDGWVFVRDGIGVAGRGEFQRVGRDDTDELLSDLGPQVVAIGARPFNPDAPWDLVVPAYQVRVDADGTVHETQLAELSDTDDPDPVDPPSANDSHDPGGDRSIGITRVDDPDRWQATVAEATARIRASEVEKVVLARELRATTPAGFSPHRLLERLREGFAGCYLYSVDGLVGASPELLVERSDDVVRSQPMAGSAQRSDDPVTDARLQAELFASPAYRHEHQLTIDMVHDTLLDFTSYLDFEPEPSIVTLENVAHLASRVEGRLSHPPASVLDLQAALHPTPAVSGRPRDAAVRMIGELETRDRGRYAGTVGWVDGSGNGSWAVSIRCAQIDQADPRTARIHAGCGLVADSEPARELAESEAKLAAILSVLT